MLNTIIYNKLELYTLIPRLIEIFFFLISGIKILRQKKYILNKIYFSAFLCWIGYIIIDIFNWTLAIQSYEMYRIANYIRDIQLSFALIFSYLIFFATRIIKKGGTILNSRISIIRTVIEIFILIVISYLANSWENLVVVDVNNVEINPFDLPPTGDFSVTISLNKGAILGSIGTFILIFSSIFNVIIIIKKGQLEQQYKKRMYLLALGITLLPIGMIYFIIINMIFRVNFITSIIGHTIWTLAPIFIYQSKKRI